MAKKKKKKVTSPTNGQVTVRYKKSNILTFNGCTLVPGVNVLTSEQFGWLEKLQAYKLQQGIIEVVSEDETEVSVALVKETFDKNLLNEWKSSVSDADTLAAIDEQLETLTVTEDDYRERESEAS